MPRPRKRKQQDDDQTPPFELGEDFVPVVVKPFEPKRYNAEGELLTDVVGGENGPAGLGRDPLVAQYLLPEWSKNISDALIHSAKIGRAHV
jgi:hypothetical protein